MFSAYHAKLNAYIKVMLNNLISLDESINAEGNIFMSNKNITKRGGKYQSNNKDLYST